MSSYAEGSLEIVEFNEKILTRTDVPFVFDDWSLAFRLGFRGKTMWYVHNTRTDRYKVFTKPKASGGLRTIHDPDQIMRLVSKQIRKHFLLPLCAQLGSHVTAYQLGKGTRDAARQHLAPCENCAPLDAEHTCSLDIDGDKVFATDQASCIACQTPSQHTCPRRGVKIHMDLKDFFGSTRRSWIRQYFHEKVGYNHYVSGLLSQLLTVRLPTGYEGVPQGSKTSGDICNLVADWKFDQKLIAALPEWKYTRYADDLYFSHQKNLPSKDINAVVQTVRTILEAAGYRVNWKKLRIQRPGKQQKILGIVLNQKMNIPAQEYRRFRALIHNCYHQGFEAQVKRAKKESVGQLIGWIGGKLAYFAAVSPRKAKRLQLIFNEARVKHNNEGLYKADAVALKETA